jgi:signal transduction histidine kinase
VRYISHELRTPINVLYMALQLLQKDSGSSQVLGDRNDGMKTSPSIGENGGLEMSRFGKMNVTVDDELSKNSESKEDVDEPSEADILHDAFEACQIAINILNNLLLFDKIEDGQMALHRSKVEVRSLLVDCVHLFEVQAKAAGVALIYKTTDQMPEILSRICVDIDAPKISQVVRTLVYNAIRFTQRGGLVSVSCSYIEANRDHDCSKSSSSEHSKEADGKGKVGTIRVEVKDTGCGMSAVSLFHKFILLFKHLLFVA